MFEVIGLEIALNGMQVDTLKKFVIDQRFEDVTTSPAVGERKQPPFDPLARKIKRRPKASGFKLLTTGIAAGLLRGKAGSISEIGSMLAHEKFEEERKKFQKPT